MRSEFDEARSLSFQPYSLFRVRPRRGRALNVAEAGYRLGRSPEPWPPSPGVTNIFVFGGSTAFGHGVADAQTIPAQLSDALARPGQGAPACVYNFATPNDVAVQERVRLEQLLLDGHVPRVAIFIDGFDEFVAPYYAPLIFRRFAVATASRMERYVEEFRGLLGRLSRTVVAVPGASECRIPEPGPVLDRYLANARLVRAVCAEFGVRPLFVWQPVPCYEYDSVQQSGTPDDRRQLLECVRTGYEMMAARRTQLDDRWFLWLADMQRGRTDDLYVDEDHYTAEFSAEIARGIARHLSSHGFLG